MNLSTAFLCTAFALLLAGGQILFKLAANSFSDRTELSLINGLSSPWLWAVLVLYAGSTALWIFILTKVPLSAAYPFSLLGSAVVPLLAFAVLGEEIYLRQIFGTMVVLLGLSIIYVR